METKEKSMWATIKGTLIGSDGEGSAKRAASAYFTMVLLTSLIGIEEYCYYLAIKSLDPTTAQMIVVRSHESIIWLICLTLWLFFGFTSVDKIIDFIKFIKGKDTKAHESATE